MNELLQRLPEGVRETLYTVLIVIGLAIGALTVAFIAATGEIPLWLAVTTAVATFLGVPVVGATARANLPASSREVAALREQLVIVDQEREVDSANLAEGNPTGDETFGDVSPEGI